jgi:zinc finger SWIM domain-containing protein 3
MLPDVISEQSAVQEPFQVMSGKQATLTDMRNSKFQRRNCKAENQLDSIVSLLEAKERSIVQVAVTEDSQLFGIFYQDAVMQKIFAKFPELLVVEEPYSVDELGMFMYLLMIVDGNGQSEIVCTFLAVEAGDETVKQVIQLFKTHNPAYVNIRAVITNRELIQCQMLQGEFPEIPLLICPLHVLELFHRDVTCEQMEITVHQRDLCLEILEGILRSKTVDEYNRKHEELVNTDTTSVIEYYDEHWESRKEQFVECYSGISVDVWNGTSNRLETIWRKIDSFASRVTTLMSFYEGLLDVCHSLLVKPDHRTMPVVHST